MLEPSIRRAGNAFLSGAWTFLSALVFTASFPLGCFIRGEATGAWSSISISAEVTYARGYRRSHITFVAYLYMEELYTFAGSVAANRRPLLSWVLKLGGTLSGARRASFASTAKRERKLRYRIQWSNIEINQNS